MVGLGAALHVNNGIAPIIPSNAAHVTWGAKEND